MYQLDQVSSNFAAAKTFKLAANCKLYVSAIIENDSEYCKQTYNPSYGPTFPVNSKSGNKNIDESIHCCLAVSAIENGDECRKHNISIHRMA